MYEKILKESASTLTLLAVENDDYGRINIGNALSRFFKEITFTANIDELVRRYGEKRFDLILIDIDTCMIDVQNLVREIHKKDAFQAIAVCSSRSGDAELLLLLLQSNIAGYIKKPSTPHEICEVLAKVCSRIHDRHMLLHYLEELEGQQNTALSASCRSGCPMKEVMKPAESIRPAAFAPSNEELAVYKDYFSFLDQDDREELHDQLNDIDASLLNAFDGLNGDANAIAKLGNALMRYGNVLLHYQFFSDMGTSILELGKQIQDKNGDIADQSKMFEQLISGFCSGLQTYMSEVWEKESNNPKFFNDSIISDATTIIGFMTPIQTVSGSDDLFFF